MRTHLIKSQRGFSLLETLIGAAVLSGVMLSLIYSSEVSTINYGMAGTNFQCQTNLNSGFAYLQSLGVQSLIANPPSSGQSTPPPALFSINGFTPSDLWSSEPPLVSSPNWVNSSSLIDGTIRALLAIYNNDHFSCTNSFGYDYAPLDSYLNSQQPGIVSLSTKIRIQPYDLSTGALQPCTFPLMLMPKGINNPAQNAFASPGTVYAQTKQKSNLGLEVTLVTTYTNEKGLSYSCQGTRQFAYQYNNNVPNPIVDIQQNTSPICQTGGQIKVEVGYDPSPPGGFGAHNPNETGTIFLCKDTSVRNTYAPGNLSQCLNPAGGTVLEYPKPGAPPSSSVNGANQWVSCDQVTLCGVAPSSTMTSYPSVINTYNNLPQYCTVGISAVAVDTAGNMSAPVPATFSTLPGYGNVQPFCQATAYPLSAYCAPNGTGNTWDAAALGAYPNGYYNCAGYYYSGSTYAGCCTGAACL